MKRMVNWVMGLTLGITLHGQQLWTLDECVTYAVQHNLDVRKQERILDEYRTEHTRRIGVFLPSVNGSVGGQYNFGRAVDPETNTYTNVNTFYNNYNLQASFPIFEGFSRLYDLKAARARVLMGKQGLQSKKDEVAQHVLSLCMDVIYLEGAVKLAIDKYHESKELLKKTQIMQEIDTKSEADVAQVQATVAADDYEVTNQQNLLKHAWLALKKEMNYPLDDSLKLDTLFLSQGCCEPTQESVQEILASLGDSSIVLLAPLIRFHCRTDLEGGTTESDRKYQN